MSGPTHEDLMRRIEDTEHANAQARELVAGSLGRIEVTLEHHTDTLRDINIRVVKLEADGNRREGRDGVFSALWRSPAIAWAAAAAAALWAAIVKLGDRLA
jgi:hypothetical protein